MQTDCLKRNIEFVTERVQRAAARAGRRVTLVAATKTVPSETVNAAIDLGITDVGENRVQEYIAKRDGVKPVKWHFIGSLQRNKAKYLVGDVGLIQSVSSVALAQEIDRLAAKRGVVQDVLAEVNICGESAKTGAPESEIDALIALLQTLKNVRLKGLMAVPPPNAETGVYVKAYRIFARHCGGDFDSLSVGMSGDYERAIDNGANMVRIGSAIFGARNFTGR